MPKFLLEQTPACKVTSVRYQTFTWAGSVSTSALVWGAKFSFERVHAYKFPNVGWQFLTTSQVEGTKSLLKRIHVYKFPGVRCQFFTGTNLCLQVRKYRMANFYLNKSLLQVPRWRAPNGYLSGSVSASSQVYGIFLNLNGSAPSSSKG